jgi:hypothetical protein
MKKFWSSLAEYILSHRPALLFLLLLTTLGLGYFATQIKMAYEIVKILPASDPNYQLYEGFKQRYGEDGSVMVIAVQTDAMYRLPFFGDWYDLSKRVKRIEGIQDVVSNADLYEVVRNDSAQRFDFRPVLARKPTTQAELDSLPTTLARLPFYKGFIFSKTEDDSPGNAHLMAVTFDRKTINDKSRIGIVREIQREAQALGQKHGVAVHLSGMPYIRTEFMRTVSNEMILFMALAVGVTALILGAVFRTFNAVFYPMLVVLLGGVMAMGILVLCGYQISILTGLVPPLIIVIGIPNSIFLLNKYYEEYARDGDQRRALATAIEKIGQTTFLANLTTAIGFGVFAFTGSKMLVEFGLVAAISVLLTYVVSLVFIPIVFSYLPPPKTKHVERLEGKRIMTILGFIDRLVHQRRPVIYGVVAALVLASLYGMTRITAIGYVVDDLPENSPVLADLKFIERNFKGILPFEVSVDAGRPGRVLTPPALTKLRRMEREVAATTDALTEPLSIVRAVKFLYQGYRGGAPKYYVVPPLTEITKMSAYLRGTGSVGKRYASFLDSTQRYTRVSFQMPDMGTVKTKELVGKLQPKIDSIFNWDTEAGRWVDTSERYDARLTGNSVVFTKGNDYLQNNLLESTGTAVVLICAIMAGLFLNARMLAIATIPSLIPLLITAGLMGYFQIPLKPSTILIFSIAFGIASDGTIYFLTRYKDELKNGKLSIPQAVTKTIRSTGVSMFYTVLILFSGFFIFAASTFKGTQSLGILISITLLVAMISNLILLPAFLISLDKREQRRAEVRRTKYKV